MGTACQFTKNQFCSCLLLRMQFKNRYYESVPHLIWKLSIGNYMGTHHFSFPTLLASFSQIEKQMGGKRNKNGIVSSKYSVPLKLPALICTLFHTSEFLTCRSDLNTHVFPCECCVLRHLLFPVVVHSVAKKLGQNILIKACGRREVEKAIDKSWLDSSSCHQTSSSCWVNFNWLLFFFWQVHQAWFIIIHELNQAQKTHENNRHLRVLWRIALSPKHSMY